MIQMGRFRICVCYLVTTLLISGFVYSLISNNIQTMKKLERLREDVDEIAHLVLRTPQNDRETHRLSDMVDNMLKKRLAGIWDDLYALKKFIKGGSDCGPNSNGADRNSKDKHLGSVVKVEKRVNYASEELGAKVIHVKAEPVCSPNLFRSWMGMDFSANPPIRMLRSSMEPGNCFAYKKDKAEVTIMLAHEISVDTIVVEHIFKKLSPTGDTSSAPKDFHVFGIDSNLNEFSLGRFRFENNPDEPLEHFTAITNDHINYLRFAFESNHGHPNYTCIYRIAVYGKL